MILAPAGVFWLAALGQFIGTLTAVLVIGLLWYAVDWWSRRSAAAKRAATPKLAEPITRKEPLPEPGRLPGRHHERPRDPQASTRFDELPRIGPPGEVRGVPPWEAPPTRPTLKDRSEPS